MLGKVTTEICVCQESEQKGGNGFIEMEETPGEPLVGWKVSTFPAFLGTQRIIMILKWKIRRLFGSYGKIQRIMPYKHVSTNRLKGDAVVVCKDEAIKVESVCTQVSITF